jgi:CDP-paratose 2-epimerase
MKILITGICGFAGSSIAKTLLQSHSNLQIIGLDNFSRKGSELNTSQLSNLGINLIRGDIRSQSDMDALPKVDWVIDCAANPSVLAGIDGQSSSRQLMEHNLLGTINLLEYCKSHKAGLILLSTSRVYSASELAALPVKSSDHRFELQDCDVRGTSSFGISEDFPTTAPLSLYGASKLASETLILEYGECFDFPVWINRCGVLAGAGQFGKPDQGIFSFWIHSFGEKKPLKYIGFNGSGHQLRDALHPQDLVPLLTRQILEPDSEAPKIINLGGGIENSMSLKELSNWCEDRFGENDVLTSQDERPMDAPWIVMDSTTAQKAWNWTPQTKLENILEEIASHAKKNPNWLSFTN